MVNIRLATRKNIDTVVLSLRSQSILCLPQLPLALRITIHWQGAYRNVGKID